MPDPGRPAAPGPDGLLNGVPVGPVLPEPVPCEGCGAPVYCTEDGTAREEGTGERRSVRGVWERDLLAEMAASSDPLAALGVGARFSWHLRPHPCPLTVRTRERRVGLLTGEPLDDDDAQD
jgi:hypothetical protein